MGLLVATRGMGVLGPATPAATTSAVTSATEQPTVARTLEPTAVATPGPSPNLFWIYGPFVADPEGGPVVDQQKAYLLDGIKPCPRAGCEDSPTELEFLFLFNDDPIPALWVPCLSDPEGTECHAAIYTDLGPPVTPKPTPKPTRKPTPKPTANPLAGTTALTDFRTRQRQGAYDLLNIITDAGSDRDLGDYAAFQSDGARLEQRANTEIRWLKARRPQPCYASLWKKQLVYLGDLAKAGHYAKAGNLMSYADYLGFAAEHVPDINDIDVIDRCDTNPAKPG